MTRTVLIDLDDTLLENSMDTFLPAYFQRLGDYLSDVVDAQQMLPALMAGTRAMIGNQDPTVTLERVFAKIYYPELGLDENALHDRINHFYTEIFPELESLTSVRPQARDFMEWLFENNFEVVIATNPLFPLLAIEARLRWAGLPAQASAYSLITSYENFHFTKPAPAYYAEILGLLGRSPSDAVMIGNDISADLEPADALGMPVFHLQNIPLQRFPGGDFEAAESWLPEAQDSADPTAVNQPEIIIARLKAHLGALLTSANHCSAEAWTQRPAENEWAPIEIVAHLADVEREVNLPRLNSFLDQLEPHLSAFDTDIWAEQRGYIDYPPAETLAAFAQNRLSVIQKLEDLEPEGWLKEAVHSLLGPTTLAEVMNIAVEHDLLHLAQMRGTIGFPL